MWHCGVREVKKLSKSGQYAAKKAEHEGVKILVSMESKSF